VDGLEAVIHGGKLNDGSSVGQVIGQVPRGVKGRPGGEKGAERSQPWGFAAPLPLEGLEK
jgi:hypothetical protein